MIFLPIIYFAHDLENTTINLIYNNDSHNIHLMSQFWVILNRLQVATYNRSLQKIKTFSSSHCGFRNSITFTTKFLSSYIRPERK